MFAPAAAALPHVQSGRLRALAVTSAARLKALPDVPTMGEAGLCAFVVEQWQAVFAPAGTPAPIVDRLNRDINAALKTADVVALADKLGITLVGGTPAQLGALQKSDSAKKAEVIRKGGIKADDSSLLLSSHEPSQRRQANSQKSSATSSVSPPRSSPRRRPFRPPSWPTWPVVAGP